MSTIVYTIPPAKSAVPTFRAGNTTRSYPNGMKVSDVAYPTYFPAAYTHRIGNEKVIGLARLTVPVSQDNHGARNLIAFCTDGVYTFNVDQSGSKVYTNMSYFVPDVCVNRNSICEIGGAVLFASDKGLMILTSQGVQEFCPMLGGEIRFSPSTASGKSGASVYNKMVTNTGLVNDSHSVFEKNFNSYISTDDFNKFIKDEKTVLAYISSKNKVLAFNGTETYFIDIDTRNTCKLGLNIIWKDNNYPTPAMWSSYDSGAGSYRYEKLTFEYLTQTGDINCLIQSRPVKIQQDDKCSYRLVMSGFFNGDANSQYWAGVVLLGSLDAEHWRVIGVNNKKLNGGFHDFGCLSERGTWKYVMFIFTGYLHTDSHVDSIELTVNGRYNNKKR